MDVFGRAWTWFLNFIGRVWACLGVHVRAWACLAVIGRSGTCIGVLGCAWACWAVLGRVGRAWGVFGRARDLVYNIRRYAGAWRL
jgi:hypothetical protein